MSKSLVQQQFGANAANYVTSRVHAKGASLARMVELAKPQKHWRALDIATAAGHTALTFAPHVASVIASDITPEMLEQANGQIAEKGAANVTTQIADAEALPFSDQSFELVTCRIAPHHLPDQMAFVAEVARVLTPGGVFALVDNVSPDETTTAGFSTRELKDAAVTYNAFEKIRDPSHGRALTVAEWRELVVDAGLAIEAAETIDKAMDFATWCKTMSVPAGTVPKLEAMLREPAHAFRAFIRPSESDGKLGFMLIELLLIARKA